MILSYSSTELIRFNGNMAEVVQVDSFKANRLGWHFKILFPFLLSLLQYMPARRLVPLNTNADCILLSGVLAVTSDF